MRQLWNLRSIGIVATLFTAAACGSSGRHATTTTSNASPTTTTTQSAVASSIPSTAAEPTSTETAQPSTSASVASADGTVGIVALGHSALTGENSSDTSPGRAAYANSWATGASPAVNSIYLRLLAVRPDTKGHVANEAVGGAVASSLPEQANSALRKVTKPQLVIIETIDNDIRCDGTDQTHIPELGASVAEALKVITAASPNSKILLVGQFGRPDATYIEQLVAAHPELKPSMQGTGPCDSFDPSGNINQQGIATLTGIIDAYEAEENRVCAQVPQCANDGGVRKQWVDHLDWYSSDFGHLNVTGLAHVAEQLWPVVQQLLKLS